MSYDDFGDDLGLDEMGALSERRLANILRIRSKLTAALPLVGPLRQKVIKKKGTTTLPLVAPRPPARVLKSLKDHVEYLRQYCLTRVACAASVVGSAAAVMSLSTDELRSLRDDAPKCVQRCQR